MKHPQRGQVLVFFALVVPIALLPLVAFAVDSAVLASRFAALQAATAQAAELAAQRIDVSAFRATGDLLIDGTDLKRWAADVVKAEDPYAAVDSVSAAGATITLETHELVDLPVPLLARASFVRASVTARLVPGYDSPSSAFPLSTSTF